MKYEREIVGEDFAKKMKTGKRNNKKKLWKENFGRDSEEKKDVKRKFRKITL
jgi:hypothetical protein